MEIFIPMTWLLLACIAATLTAIVGLSPLARRGVLARGVVGSGSVLAGCGWFAALLLCALPSAAQEAAEAPPAASDSKPVVTPEQKPEATSEKAAENKAAASQSDEQPQAEVKAAEKPTPDSSSADKSPDEKSAEEKSPSEQKPDAAAPLVEAPESSESSSRTEPRALSVAPSSSIGLAKFDREKRPAWVEAPSNHVGAIHTTAIASGAWLSPDEGRRALDDLALKATREYVAELVNHPRSDMLSSTYDLAFVKSRVLQPQNIYEEQIEGQLSGSSYQAHALLEFDAGFRDEALRRWREIVTRMRLLQSGLVAGGVLLMVALMFGLLRADTATRGYYTRTLQWVAAVAILGVVAAGVLLAKNIPWL